MKRNRVIKIQSNEFIIKHYDGTGTVDKSGVFIVIPDGAKASLEYDDDLNTDRVVRNY